MLERNCKDFSADSLDPVKVDKGAAWIQCAMPLRRLQEGRGLESEAFRAIRKTEMATAGQACLRQTHPAV